MQERRSEPPKPARLALFGPPPLITGEDSEAYYELLARVSADVSPKDILEEFWVRDIVDLFWELLRLRRIKAGLFNANAYQSLRVVLKPLIDKDMQEYDGEQMQEQNSEVDQENEEEISNQYLEENWARRIPAAVDKVSRVLAQSDLTMDAVNAYTLSNNIDAMERIERMLAATEARRNAVMREIDRHRASLAQPLRRTLEQIEEGEYEVIEPKSDERKKTA